MRSNAGKRAFVNPFRATSRADAVTNAAAVGTRTMDSVCSQREMTDDVVAGRFREGIAMPPVGEGWQEWELWSPRVAPQVDCRSTVGVLVRCWL
jgi:hypothetical protein